MSFFYIGTSGWVYPHWRRSVYPLQSSTSEWLSFYAGLLNSVEINSSFYRLPSPEDIKRWCGFVPQDFIFSIKASRYITHMKKLREPSKTLEPLLERTLAFGTRLGPILFQLPPRWRKNLERLETFLQRLPTNLHYAFEFRDPSWFHEDTFALLSKYNIALCIYESGAYGSPREITADFSYVRLHGPDAPYRGRYSEHELLIWAQRMISWRKEGISTYCYFDNDESGFAFHNAQRLRQLIYHLKASPGSE